MLKKTSFQQRLTAMSLITIIVPMLALGVISYITAKRAIFDQIEDKLITQAESYSELSLSEFDTADSLQSIARGNAKEIVTNQLDILTTLITPDMRVSESDIQKISSLTIGQTGYFFVIDSTGTIVQHKIPSMVGRNIYNAQDNQGNYFIQDMIAICKTLDSNEVGYSEYEWQNEGEDAARGKIAALTPAPHLGGYLAASTYFDELVDMNIVDSIRDKLLNRMDEEVVGVSGYMFVMNGEGTLITHPSMEGENISQHAYIQEMLRNKSGYIKYEWTDGEKVVAYEYLPEQDWIIASGSYLSDFTGPITQILKTIILSIIISVLLGVTLSMLFSSSTSKNIKRISDTIKDASDQGFNASGELSSSSVQIASHATELAATVQDITESLQELSCDIEGNVGAVKEVQHKTTITAKCAEDSNVSMENMKQVMYDIMKASEETQEIISDINEIAFKTNLLSLNAAVEAARAGEAGRGFAVVADEVRTLAQRAAEAASDTAQLLEDARKHSRKGVDVSEEVHKEIEEIISHMGVITNEISSVTDANEKQSQRISEISESIANVDSVTQSSAASSEEMASASEEIVAQAGDLNDQVLALQKLIYGDKSHLNN